ncbi:hypothetical protein RCO27_10545 [Sphingosinicella sp. LHD-64]|uniref:hypothetical protein n=1 Tax=Sphingosinicella sp. LHD-64 TaxID=3072139 RepID=UPI00281024F6|nr:hypothetical protein [Sphingosinicella sp. LHD-64]MDQ8756672.1 hypothetical protein [Sphingosinicella sp. LHD-64]
MPTVEELLDAPARLLHEMDVAGGRLRFLPVARNLLERANFLDGRAPIAIGDPIDVGVDQALATPLARPSAPDRYIFHVSFCGSTLLTRMLEQPGKVFALREPHCLVTLADWKAKHAPRGSDAVGPLADFARAALRARWRPREAVLVKPSNWANNLLRELTASPAMIRPLFVGIAPRAFLRAVFRGNRERLAFTIHAAQHLAKARDSDGAQLAAAVAVGDPLEKGARIALLALHIQLRDFRGVMAAGGWDAGHMLSYEDIVGAPFEAAQAANTALALGLTANEIADGIVRSAHRNAKIAGRDFLPEQQDGVNDAVEHGNGRHFDAALAWAEATLPEWDAVAIGDRSASAFG